MRKAPPTAVQLDRISVHAIRMALKTNAAECRCPFSGRDHGRREHWITIYRRWHQEKNQDRAMSAKTHLDTILRQPAEIVLGTLEVSQQRLSIAAALEIILIVGFAILRAFQFVHSRRSGGSEW
jgi:hypothetical protein